MSACGVQKFTFVLDRKTARVYHNKQMGRAL
nr:MAG TPA: hypothetical protein [Caudoviricetes sp.]